MNTRLQIAATILAGLAAKNESSGTMGEFAKTALTQADVLISVEDRTRKAEDPKTTDDSRLAAEIRTFIRELSQGKRAGVSVVYVTQELEIMLERANARSQA